MFESGSGCDKWMFTSISVLFANTTFLFSARSSVLLLTNTVSLSLDMYSGPTTFSITAHANKKESKPAIRLGNTDYTDYTAYLYMRVGLKF